MTKFELIDRMLHYPLNFTQVDMQLLVNSGLEFDDLRQCVRKIYDLNEEQLKEISNANSGILGKLNRKSTSARQKEYYRKIEKQKSGKKYIRIYAEGDSWFQFPVFVDDIIDWLRKREDYLIFTEAYGGDWITNIIYEGQYITSLTTHSPEVFLISGGGNDLVGNNRMAVMVDTNANYPKYTSDNPLNDPSLTKEETEMIMLAQPYITKELYAFLWVMKSQYSLLFNRLYAPDSKHREMISITHGYAYPYPKKGSNLSLNPIQPIVNSFLDSGQWLFRPLMIKGILDNKIQRAIVLSFIYEFNIMMIELANNYEKVYHVDCRKVPENQSDWYDELHLKSKKFKQVSDAYCKIIDEYKNEIAKVIEA
jgi:hypothetical protein